MYNRILWLTAIGWLIAQPGHAADYLMYLEAQGIAGYSSQQDKMVFNSKDEAETMQKPSIGVDYLQRFSGATGDFASFALQARLAYDDQDGEKNAEAQLYNAWFKYKAGWSDVWIGHNRPALGLSSYFDSHALLLDTVAMNGFGYDRDWGVGTYRDFSWGNLAVSLTTGSGMPIYFKGNYLAAVRASRGTLNQDNYNLGFSAGYGKTLETMGYNLIMDEPQEMAMAGVDLTWLWDNFESRWEAMGGRNQDENAVALFWRFGVNLLDEARLKLEIQPMYLKIGTKESYQIAAGPSWLLTPDITLRSMYHYDEAMDDHRVVFQIYWYRKL
ncbi:MAG TPA: hypothetical protein VLP30_08745 [Desulfatirhabdiaceae bacterium]|nr:hypothetical protein [Desulfatirhabdiaceae bacterium]